MGESVGDTMRSALSGALAALALVGCGSPTSPDHTELTGYLLTFTPSSWCSGLYPRPFPIVLARGEAIDGWQSFVSARTVGGPRDPSLVVRLRNRSSGGVEGLVAGGTQTAELPPRLLMFSTQADPFLFPSPDLPFEAIGELGSTMTAVFGAAILGSSTVAGLACVAFDHRLQFTPVFEALDF